MAAGLITKEEQEVFKDVTFAGRVVAITGAGSGIGRSLALQLADEGAAVVLADLDGDRVAAVRDEVKRKGAAVAAHRTDVSDEAAVSDFFGVIEKGFGKLDGLATCAGKLTTGRVISLSSAEWTQALQINLLGTFYCLQRAYRLMLPRQSGAIVTVASDAGKRGSGKRASSAYAAAKSGVLALTKSAAREHARSGVRINSVCPGPTRTNLFSGVDEAGLDEIGAGLPIGRMGQPEEIARVITFLLSDAASFVYGASFNVDGGSLLE